MADGYQNRFILIPFDDLADGCSVLIRNPKLLPPDKLEAVSAASESSDPGAARQAMNSVMADVIVAWHNVYPADEDLADIDLDNPGDLAALMETLESRSQEPLGRPTVDTVARLPLTITNRVAEEFKKITTPQ
ncbi:hypothetical protein [Streptacidiphilus sp. EB129]|uniref:hypothetical protein n=1 Tax=Streptacidiphilus sp. EB129 TaxID=3156262 RepID=UPI00351728B6